MSEYLEIYTIYNDRVNIKKRQVSAIQTEPPAVSMMGGLCYELNTKKTTLEEVLEELL